MEDVASSPTPEPPRSTLICGACRAVVQATQVPDFCGRCQRVGAPFLALRTVVEAGAGASLRVRMETTFHGEWDAEKRAAWEARLGGRA